MSRALQARKRSYLVGQGGGRRERDGTAVAPGDLGPLWSTTPGPNCGLSPPLVEGRGRGVSSALQNRFEVLEHSSVSAQCRSQFLILF